MKNSKERETTLHHTPQRTYAAKARAKGVEAVRLNKKELLERIMAFLTKENKQAFNYKQIAFAIGATHPANRIDLITILEELTAAEQLVEVSLGKYKAPSNRGTMAEGVFMRRSTGKNSVVIDDEQIFVDERNSMHALNGDKVRVMIAAGRRGQEPEARVVEIIEKKPQQFIGTLRVDRNYCLLVPDTKSIAVDILIPRGKLKGGKDGDKAVVRIVKWPEGINNPTGEVVDVLGKKGQNDTEMHAILAEFGLPYKYPETVAAAAEKIDAGITAEEIGKREDFRSVTTFTIDPKDAKDFDDALSLRRLSNGLWEVGVHIADVTHYVQPNTIIDKEGKHRGTSVYLVDRTIPMLPEHLSNGICSLRPGEEKLTYSVVFNMDDDAKVVNYRIVGTVIKSDRRFTYEEAQEIIETGKGDYAAEVLTLNRLAQLLRERRYRQGALDFGRAEVRFDIDDNGKPVAVYFKEAKEANKLIEEFMLLANLSVAEWVGKVPKGVKAKTFVYRVHDNPDPEKLQNLSGIAARFGYRVQPDGNPREVNTQLNRLLVDVKGKGEENMLSMLTIRSMAKAVYTTDNRGHYGLAIPYYTHFTSPIRRYPDMMVHRLLRRYAAQGRSVPLPKTEELCRHCSDMEQLAANAERASIRYKQVEYMQARLGEVYEGVISGITEWGFYVELKENMCEGLVPVRDLVGDYYDFDEKNYCLVGRRTHHRYTLGDEVKVQVARADLEKKQLDFALIDAVSHPARPLPPMRGKKRPRSRRR